MEWVGSEAFTDIPVPSNVRRYYVPSTTHGGGGGGFNENIAAGNAWRQGYLLPQDMINLVSQAQASNVCNHGASKQSCDPAAP